MILPLAITHVEIRWVIKVVFPSASFRSCLELNELFKSIFSDSAIASAFQLSKTKCLCYIRYSIAPFIRNLLSNDIKLSPFFSVVFDDCLNKVMQQSQADTQVIFW